MSNFANAGQNGVNINRSLQASGGGLFGGGGFSTGVTPHVGAYARAGVEGYLPIAINNSYLFANAGGNYQHKNNSQASFGRQFGAATNLGGLLGVKYTDSDRAKDLEISALSPLGMFSVNKTTGLEDTLRGTFESGISPVVGAKLTASVEKEKAQALKYMTEISLSPFEHTTLSTKLYGQGKNTGFGINLNYSRTF
jgi:hypothetical protein